MWAMAPWFISGMGLGWYQSRENDTENNKQYYGPISLDDYLDRPTWFNPISRTNADSYFIGFTILVLLYILKK